MTDKEEELKKEIEEIHKNFKNLTKEELVNQIESIRQGDLINNFRCVQLESELNGIQEGKAEAEKEQECRSCGCKTNILFCADCCLDRNEVIRLKHTFIDILKDEIEFLESLLREDDVFALLCERLSQLKLLNSQLEIEPKGNIKPSADTKEKTI